MTLIYELDLDIRKTYSYVPKLMTLIYELDLDILKTQLRTKTEVSRSTPSTVRARTDRQTNRRHRTYYQAAFAWCKN